MTKKQILRCVSFLVVAFMTVLLLCDMFQLKNTYNYVKRFHTYRNLSKNTVDAVFVGSSGTDRYWMAAKAYEEYGMTAFTLSVDEMPSWLYTNVLDEVYKYQNPEVVFIDIRVFGQNNTKLERMDTRARRVLDSMPLLSYNRIKAAFKTMKCINKMHPDQPKFDASFILPFIKFHTRWQEEDYKLKENIGNTEHLYAGYFINKTRSVQVTPQKAKAYDFDLEVALDPLAEESLYELIDYIKEKNINAVFIDTPQYKSKEETGRGNVVYKILEENGMEYINFFTDKSDGSFTVDLDPKQDFYDDAHVNYYGAEKFTEYFAKYLKEKYDFPDRRNDENVKEYWDGKYDAIKDKIAEFKSKKK